MRAACGAKSLRRATSQAARRAAAPASISSIPGTPIGESPDERSPTLAAPKLTRATTDADSPHPVSRTLPISRWHTSTSIVAARPQSAPKAAGFCGSSTPASVTNAAANATWPDQTRGLGLPQRAAGPGQQRRHAPIATAGNANGVTS